MCYPACPNGYTGVGPLCWGANSPTTFPVKCNDLIWAKDNNTCSAIARALGTAGGTSTACIGTVIAAAVTIIGWPVAAVVCGTSLPSTVDAVNNIMELTGAKTCPSSVNVISSM